MPFHKFATLVQRAGDARSRTGIRVTEVWFRVTRQAGKVNLTARAVKPPADDDQGG